MDNMSVEQNKEQIIRINNYGKISISNNEIILYINKYLQSFLSFKVDISTIDIIDNPEILPVIKLIVFAKSKSDFIFDKIDLIAETVNMFLQNNIGIKISSVQVGVTYKDED